MKLIGKFLVHQLTMLDCILVVTRLAADTFKLEYDCHGDETGGI